MSDEECRVAEFAQMAVRVLVQRFGHSTEDARMLFDAFHAYYSASGGWAPADYYDHEGPVAVALEIEYHHRFPERDRRGIDFLEWRKHQWK